MSTSRSARTRMPAASSALRAAVTSWHRKCATAWPSTTHAPPPSMLTPARPRASPISAKAPGRFSSAIVRSFIAPPALNRKKCVSMWSFLYFFDLLQRNRVGAAAGVDASGDLHKFADEGQKPWAQVDIGHLGRDGMVYVLILG